MDTCPLCCDAQADFVYSCCSFKICNDCKKKVQPKGKCPGCRTWEAGKSDVADNNGWWWYTPPHELILDPLFGLPFNDEADINPSDINPGAYGDELWRRMGPLVVPSVVPPVVSSIGLGPHFDLNVDPLYGLFTLERQLLDSIRESLFRELSFPSSTSESPQTDIDCSEIQVYYVWSYLDRHEKELLGFFAQVPYSDPRSVKHRQKTKWRKSQKSLRRFLRSKTSRMKSTKGCMKSMKRKCRRNV